MGDVFSHDAALVQEIHVAEAKSRSLAALGITN